MHYGRSDSAGHAEARMRFPLKNLSIELAVRLQDDGPRPDRGFATAGELAVRYQL